MRIYVSHSDADTKFVAELRQCLTRKGFDVWNPDRDLQPGGNWLLETGRALERADAIVFILSPTAVKSSSVRKEINYAITTRRLANRVLTVILGNIRGSVPWILLELGVIDILETGDLDPTSALRVATAIEKRLTANEPARDARKKRLIANEPVKKKHGFVKTPKSKIKLQRKTAKTSREAAAGKA